MDNLIEEINLHKDKKYLATIDEDIEILLDVENKYNLIYNNSLSFLIKHNYTAILLQNFIQYNLKLPIFQNSVILENNSNDSNESFKILLSRLPFELIVAEDDNFINYLLEQSLDVYDELVINKICGFYLNVTINKIDVALTFYDHIIPFIIEQDQVKILKKNDILKYWIFYFTEKSSRQTSFKMIFLTGNENSINNNIINSLIDVLDLDENFESLKEKFDNNNILIKNQNREKNFTSYITTLNYEDYSLVKLKFDLYFTINLDKQFHYHYHIIAEMLKLLKGIIKETIIEINEKKDSYKYKICNDEIYMQSIKIFKNYRPDLTYFKIFKKYNFLISFICKCNNIPFGSNLLILNKNTILNESVCLDQINKFETNILDIITLFFKDIKPHFKKKIDFLK
jgi:hypothetical protein